MAALREIPKLLASPKEVRNAIDYSRLALALRRSLGVILCLSMPKTAWRRVNISMLKAIKSRHRNVGPGTPQRQSGNNPGWKYAICPLRSEPCRLSGPCSGAGIFCKLGTGQAARLSQILNIASVNLTVSRYLASCNPTNVSH